MIFYRTICVTLCVAIGCGSLSAQVDGQQRENLSAIDSYRALQGYEREVAEDGLSQELVDRILWAYVNLAFDDDMRWRGDRGLFWVLKGEQFAERAAQDGGFEKTVEPLLWFAALRGRGQYVVDTLRSRDDIDEREANALYIFATADWRPLYPLADHDPTPRELFAFMTAANVNILHYPLERISPQDGAPAFADCILRTGVTIDSTRYYPLMIGVVYSYLVALLDDERVQTPETQADSYALAQVLGYVGTDTDCLAFLKGVDWQRVPWSGPRIAAVWQVLWRIREHNYPQQGWELVNPNDWAAKCMSNLCIGFERGAGRDFMSHYNYVCDETMAAPGMLGAAARFLNNKGDNQSRRAFAAAMQQEVERTDGVPFSTIYNYLRLFDEELSGVSGQLVQALGDHEESRYGPTAGTLVPLSAKLQFLETTDRESALALSKQVQAVNVYSAVWAQVEHGYEYRRRSRVASSALKFMPWRVDMLYSLGGREFRMNRLPRAIRLLRQLYDMYPEHPHANKYLGGAYLYSGQPREGIPVLQTVIDEGRSTSVRESRHYLAQCYEDIGDYSAAERVFQQVLVSRPEQWMVLSAACHYLISKKFAAAHKVAVRDGVDPVHRDLLLLAIGLADSGSNKIDVPAVLARLRDANFESVNLWIGHAVTELELQKPFLSVFASKLRRLSPAMRNMVGLWHLEVGEIRAARSIYDDIISGNRRGITNHNLAYFLGNLHLTSQLLGEPGPQVEDWEAVRLAHLGSKVTAATVELFTGTKTFEQCAAGLVDEGQRAKLGFSQAFLELANGNISEARALWEKVAAASSHSWTGASARSLLKWVDGWSDNERKAWETQSQADLFPIDADKTPVPKGADDF